MGESASGSRSGTARVVLAITAALSTIIATLIVAMPPGNAASCESAPDASCQRWQMKYDGQMPSTDTSRPGFGDDIAAEMVASSEAVFVTGRSEGVQTGDDYATVAYNGATGARLWAVREDKSDFDSPFAIAVSPDGDSVYVTGEIHVDGKEREIYTVAYSARTGVKLWEVVEDGSTKIDRPRDIEVSPDNSLVVLTSESQIPTGASSFDWDAVTIAYETTQGDRVWKSTYDGPEGSFDFGRALDIRGSSVFVTGRSYGRDGGTLNLDYATISYNLTSGAQQWAARFATPDVDEPFDVVTNPNGSGVYVTGESDSDIVTVAYNPSTGAELWSDRYDSPDPNPTGSPHGGGRAITTSPSGDRIFVVGDSYVGQGLDITTIEYTPAGVMEDEAVLTGADGNDFAKDIVAARSGSSLRVVATGERQSASTGRDITVVAYDEDLTQRWVRDRGGDRNDQAVSVAIDSPTALTSVYSTGSDDASGTNFDYDTVAYDAQVVDPSPTDSASTSASATSTSTATATATSTSTATATSTSTASPSPTGSTSASPTGSPSPSPTSTTTPTPQPPRPECDDGIDNDGDGRIDYPDDPSCNSSDDDTEATLEDKNDCSDVVPGERSARPGGGLVVGGTSGRDRLRGSGGNDLMCGFGGNDEILGRGGSDDLSGQRGSDLLLGKRGPDDLRGGRGPDTLKGGTGRDDLLGGRGRDLLKGGSGNDRCSGGPGADTTTSC